MIKCLIEGEWFECKIEEDFLCSDEYIVVAHRGGWMYFRKDEEGITWFKK